MLLLILIIIVLAIVLSNMAKNKTGIFAKKGNCAKCNKEVDSFNRLSLKDGNLLCGDCSSRVPSFFREYAINCWSIHDFDTFISYLNYSNEKLLPIFDFSASYGDLLIDEQNGLFLVRHGIFSDSIQKDVPIFEFKNLENVNFNFEPEKMKEGFFGVTVKGNVSFTYEMNNINFGESLTIQYNETAHAEQNFLKTKVTYDLPEDLKDFEMRFIATYLKFMPAKSSNSNKVSNELNDALQLFMFDSIEEVSHEKLKEQRNRLIKAFHPDANGEIDGKYAAKINNAFKVLEANIPT